ncbi:MAG: hypothetical protein QOI12_2073 [Alphaproteobacteria bacterium]|jgi:hypothetical protein|nr:hypothetical protein [Alphaproteobacteria bacterium]
MSTTHLAARQVPPSRPRRADGRVLAGPLLALLALIVGASGFIAFVLWPRWPEPPVGLGAPALPITIAGVAFNVPPAAIRVPVQRRPGAHDRVDLALVWPSLEPPDVNAGAPAASAGAPTARTLERIFVTISAAGNTLPPAERLKTIYPRYAVAEPVAGPGGLAVLAFREGTPYQGEDLIYDAAAPDAFIVRCSRNGAGPTPGICLLSRRIDTADVVVRFPRDWLNEWRFVADTIERLIKMLRPTAG